MPLNFDMKYECGIRLKRQDTPKRHYQLIGLIS